MMIYFVKNYYTSALIKFFDHVLDKKPLAALNNSFNTDLYLAFFLETFYVRLKLLGQILALL